MEGKQRNNTWQTMLFVVGLERQQLKFSVSFFVLWRVMIKQDMTVMVPNAIMNLGFG